jgi:hypothetical protein
VQRGCHQVRVWHKADIGADVDVAVIALRLVLHRARPSLSRLVLDACSHAKQIADLFAGLGPFALRLAAHRQVFAFAMTAPSSPAVPFLPT